MSELQVDSDRQVKAKRYASIKHQLMLFDFFIAAGYVLSWLILDISSSLKKYLTLYITHEWQLVLAFVVVFSGILYLLNLPLSFFSGYILPHRFGISTQKFIGWTIDQLKSLFLGMVLGGILVLVLYTILRIYPKTWWVWVAIGMVALNVLIAKLAPVLLLPIFNKYVPLDKENEDLIYSLTRLAERAGTRINGVYKFDMSRRTTAANAALTGSGNTRRIILSDTLLGEFSDDEIETIFAHELGHHVHKDVPIGIFIDSLLSVISLYIVALVLRFGGDLLGLTGPSDIAGFPLLILVFGAFGFLTMPLVNAYSRWRERRADVYSLNITGKGKVYANALTRLANKNLVDTNPELWVEIFLYSHPPLGKRISMAKNFNSPSVK